MFHKEQFLDTGSYATPSTKEIETINKSTTPETRIDILTTNSANRVPEKTYSEILDNQESLNLVTNATNEFPAGRVITYKIPSDDFLVDLKKYTDFTDSNQVIEYISLKNNFKAYKEEIKNIDYPEVAYMRIDTIPGKDKQIIYSGLHTKDQIITAIRNPSSNNPAKFWMLPPDNNIFTPQARTWRLLNIEEEDLKPLLDSDSLKTYSNDSFGMGRAQDTTIENSVMLSGGAEGYDTLWSSIGKRYGLKDNNIKHYYVQNEQTPSGNTSITYKQANEADPYLKKANKSLGRTFPSQDNKLNNLLRRNWYQIKDSDGVFAIADLKSLKEVKGGTGWAVQMGIDANKPTYVFGLNPTTPNVEGKTKQREWFKWDKKTELFVSSDVPRLTERFTGVGHRLSNKEGRKAIQNVFEKTKAEGVEVPYQLTKDKGRRKYITFDYAPNGNLIGVQGRGRREAMEEFLYEESNKGVDKSLGSEEEKVLQLFGGTGKTDISKINKSNIDLKSRIYAPIPPNYLQGTELTVDERLTDPEKIAIEMLSLWKATGGAYGSNIPYKRLLRGDGASSSINSKKVFSDLKEGDNKDNAEVKISNSSNKKNKEFIKAIAAEPDVSGKLPRQLDPIKPKVKTSRSILNSRLNKELYNKSELKAALGVERIPASYYTTGNRGVKDITDLHEIFAEEGIPHPDGLDPYDSTNWDLNSILKSIENNEPAFNDQGKLEEYEQAVLEAEEKIRLLVTNNFDPIKMKNKDVSKVLANLLFEDTRTNYRGGTLVSLLKRKGNQYRDGELKSQRGFLGPIKNLRNRKTMTELSIGVQIGGKETLIPSMVPTLNAKDVKVLQNLNIGKDTIPTSIAIKAKDHAVQRINKGQDPFYQDGEDSPFPFKGLKLNNGGLLSRLKRKSA